MLRTKYFELPTYTTMVAFVKTYFGEVAITYLQNLIHYVMTIDIVSFPKER
jgi:hypothetical protein